MGLGPALYSTTTTVQSAWSMNVEVTSDLGLTPATPSVTTVQASSPDLGIADTSNLLMEPETMEAGGMQAWQGGVSASTDSVASETLSKQDILPKDESLPSHQPLPSHKSLHSYESLPSHEPLPSHESLLSHPLQEPLPSHESLPSHSPHEPLPSHESHKPLPSHEPLPSHQPMEETQISVQVSVEVDGSILEGDSSASALSHASVELAPPSADKNLAVGSSEHSSVSVTISSEREHTPFLAPSLQQTSAYHDLVKGAVIGDDTSSDTSGQLTDANIERELLQVLEGGVVNVDEGVAPAEQPPVEAEPVEGHGSEEEKERSLSPKHVPSSASVTTQQRSSAMNASLKRRLGMRTSVGFMHYT